MKKIIISFAIISLLYSCKKEEKKEDPISTKTEAITSEKELPVPPVYLDASKTENEILAHLQERKKEIIKLQANSSPEKNNLLYENYKKENDSAIVLLSSKQEKLLEKFFEFYDYNPDTEKSTLKVPETYKNIVDSYQKANIEFWGIGEGITELRMLPDFYFKIFNGKLTADYQSYLKTISDEDKVLFSSDAAISIPWKDVSERVLARENFLKNFPSSKLVPKVKEELQEYRYAYLLGYDNTPTQNDDGGFTTENQQEFQRYLKANPKSETSEIIKSALLMPKDRHEMYKFIHQKLGLPYEE